jgi:hypothetical protein
MSSESLCQVARSWVDNFLEKFVQWEPSCSMQAYRQTEINKVTVAIRCFANAPKSYDGTPKIFRAGAANYSCGSAKYPQTTLSSESACQVARS